MDSQKRPAALLPAVLGAGVSLALARSGVLAFLFLIPLGFLAFSYEPPSAWAAAAFAALGNLFLTLFSVLLREGGLGEALWYILYFSVMALVFVWIAAPPQTGPPFLRIPAAYRLLVGAAAGALTFLPLLYAAGEGTALSAFIRSQAEAAAALYNSSVSSDVVQQSLSQQYLNADSILAILGAVVIRGGALFSCVLLLFLSRQAALLVSSLFRRRRMNGNITGFHTPPVLIWVLSFSLLAVLLGLNFNIAPLEIGAWNILTLCGILYLAQGGGILAFLLTRMSMPPLLRIALNILVFMVIFSPGINTAALGALVLLGIAENWVPFRAPKSDGSSSTPGM